MSWSLHPGEGVDEWDLPGVGKILADYDGKKIEIRAKMEAVSSQSRGSVKAPFKVLMQSLTKMVPYLFTSDVQMEVRWWTSLRDRYETDALPDVDNILKPLIDAITGPDGVMVNDCQIQRVTSYWVTSDRFHSIDIKIESFDGFMHFKETLVFVEVMRNLFFPFDDLIPPTANVLILDGLLETFKTRDEFEADGYEYDTLHYMMPIQRLFHRTRVADFVRKTAAEYLADLTSRPDYEDVDEVRRRMKERRQNRSG